RGVAVPQRHRPAGRPGRHHRAGAGDARPAPGRSTERLRIAMAFAPEVLELPGWKHVYSGKVRDLYVPAVSQQVETSSEDIAAEGLLDQRNDTVLVVASDRISAFDHVLSSEIPDKGRVLTQLSLWWFEQLSAGDSPIAHHVV